MSDCQIVRGFLFFRLCLGTYWVFALLVDVRGCKGPMTVLLAKERCVSMLDRGICGLLWVCIREIYKVRLHTCNAMRCRFDIALKFHCFLGLVLFTSSWAPSNIILLHPKLSSNLETPCWYLSLATMVNTLSLPPLQHLLTLVCLLVALSPNLTNALPMPADLSNGSTAPNLKAREGPTANGDDVIWPPFTTPVTGISFMQGPANEDGTSGPPGIVVS